MSKTLKRWTIVGLAEIVVALAAVMIAPTFLNSSKPIIGFLLWATVPTMAVGSGVYVTFRLVDASKSQRLLTRFADLKELSLVDCLEIPSARVTEKLPLLEAAAHGGTDELTFAHCSLMDLLHDET